MNYDNPASRLLQFLEKAMDYPQKQQCLSVWRALLEPVSDDLELSAKIGKLMALPSQIISELKADYPNQGETWTHWSSQVNMAFATQNMHGAWASFRDHIDGHTISYLRMASDLLGKSRTSKMLSAENLEALYKQFSSLHLQVVSAELDAGVKKYLLHYLRKIISAIDVYRIDGAAPILDAVEGMVGHAIVDMKYRDFLKEDDLGKSILETLNEAAAIITVAVGAPEIAHQLLQLTG